MSEELRGAIARAYTHPKNSTKELDPDLIESIVEEIEKELPTIEKSEDVVIEHKTTEAKVADPIDGKDSAI